jgi:HAD superfamily hydrolase (TIGR01509 family)
VGERSGRPKLLLLDLDDTIFDHVGSSLEALTRLASEDPRLRGSPPSVLAARYASHLEELHPRVLAGELSVDDARAIRVRRLFEESGSPIDASEADRLARRLRALYQASRRPVDGAEAFLRIVRQEASVVLVTNNFLEEQREKLGFLGLDRLVDGMVTSEEVGVAKPDPGLFHAALRRANREGPEAVVLGDSWASDVVGGVRAGLPVVWFNRFGAPAPSDPPGIAELRSLTPAASAWAAVVAAYGRHR